MKKIIYIYPKITIIDTGIMPDGRIIYIELNEKHQIQEHLEWNLLSTIISPA